MRRSQMVWTHHRLFGGWGCGGMRSLVLIASYHSEASNWPRNPLLVAVFARLSPARLQCRPDSCCYSKVARPQSHGMGWVSPSITPRLRRSRFRARVPPISLLRLRLSSRLLSLSLSVWVSLLSLHSLLSFSAIIRYSFPLFLGW